MNEILKEKEIYNIFISSTGYKTLLIFKLLLERPYSIEEIREVFLNDKNIHEFISDDTVRTYINSLRDAGCKISKATKNTNNCFVMTKHPFEFEMKKSYIRAFKKVSRILHNRNNITDIENFESFILKIISLTEENDFIEKLHKLLIINKLNKDIYEKIKECCKNNMSAKIIYKSAGEGRQELEIICNNIYVKSENVYVQGYNTKYQSFSTLLINRIEQILSVSTLQKSFVFDDKNVICEIYNTDYILDDDEELILKKDDKLIIKISGKDDFRMMQKILYLGDTCKVLKPDSFRNKIISQIKEMRKLYE